MIRILWALFLVAALVLAWTASATGFGVTQPLKEPVSIRQQSVRQSGSGIPLFLYFSGSGRRHRGGGLYGGK